MHVVADPSDILIVVAGGGGGYSAVAPTWCGGPNGSVTVAAAIRDYGVRDYAGAAS